MDLKDMKYPDLQRLAKRLGIKANMKSDKLIIAIQSKQQQQQSESSILTSDEDVSSAAETTDVLPKKTAIQNRRNKRMNAEPCITTDESHDESTDEKNDAKKSKSRRGKKTESGRENSAVESTTTDESQDETTQTKVKQTTRAKGRRKKFIESKSEDEAKSSEAEPRSRSSSRSRPIKSPKTTTSTTTPAATKNTSSKSTQRLVSNTKTPASIVKPTIVRKSSGKKLTPTMKKASILKKSTPHHNIRRVASLKNTPASLKRSPLAVSNKKVPARKRTPSLGKKSPASTVKNPILLAKKKTPITAKTVTPLVKKSSNKKKPLSGGKKHRRTVSRDKVNKPTVSDSGRKRKRSGGKMNSTFEIENNDTNGEAEPECKKAKSEMNGNNVTDLISTMKDDMTNDEMKTALEAALTKSVSKKMVQIEQGSTTEKSNIPRFVAYVRNKQEQSNKKPVTPGNKNWNRIHKAQFDKMDSIDDYLKKRKQRTDQLLQSVDTAKKMASESHARIQQASSLRPSAAKPTITKKENERKFVPVVTNVKDINTNFSSVTKMKTPYTASSQPLTSLNMTITKSSRKSGLYSDLNTTTTAKTPRAKPVFDLKASLSKPLSWKPYSGKLRPVDGKLKPVDGVKSMVGKPAQDKKEERRKDTQLRRTDKKLDAAMKRRGITA